MDKRNPTSVHPVADHAPLQIAAAREPLRRVLGTPAPLAADLHADEAAAYRARLVELYATAGELRVERQLLAEAARYDRAHRDEPSLRDELLGTQYVAVA